MAFVNLINEARFAAQSGRSIYLYVKINAYTFRDDNSEATISGVLTNDTW